MKLVNRFLVIFFLLTIIGPTAQAREEGGVTLTSTILRQVELENEKGEKEIDLVPVDKALPGEELIIRITYTNSGSDPVENIVIVNPVPDQTSYLVGSASGDFTLVTFSIDGGGGFDLPENLTVEDEEGSRKPAPPEIYTHIRFRRIQALQPGQTDNVSFRAVLK
ncbi:MAG: hypothetical protein P1S46_03010 [bacterium]|nr:hypothetical protein [bacterium]MDT8395732.1 hypothetical protein [bacterium]